MSDKRVGPLRLDGAVVVLSLITALYLLFGTLLATRTPLFQNPDEPSHFLVVEQMSAFNHFPEAILQAPNSYEALQPPLYYVVLSPIAAGTGSVGSELIALRIAGVFIGLALIPLAFFVARLAFEDFFSAADRDALSLAVAAFVALLPQSIAMNASVNNDSLGNVLSTLLIWLALKLTRGHLQRFVHYVLIGLVVAAALLTKLTTAGPAVVLMGAAVVCAVRLRPSAHKQWPRLVAVCALPVLILTPWLISNVMRYGDPLGHSRFHEFAFASDLPRWGEPPLGAGLGDPPTGAGLFALQGIESFWATLGWMTTPPPGGLTVGLITISFIALAGSVIFLARALATKGQASTRLILIFAVAMIQLAWFAWFNLTQFFQPQGRYLFPALCAFAVLFVLGLTYWLPVGENRHTKRASGSLRVLALGIGVGLVALNVFVQIEMVPRIPDPPCPICPGGSF